MCYDKGILRDKEFTKMTNKLSLTQDNVSLQDVSEKYNIPATELRKAIKASKLDGEKIGSCYWINPESLEVWLKGRK